MVFKKMLVIWSLMVATTLANNNCKNQIVPQTTELLENLLSKIVAQTTRQRLPTSCYEATRQSQLNGVYEIEVPGYIENKPFSVYCDESDHLGGWTVVQRRIDWDESFNRPWLDYKHGFGDLRGDHFIGLDKLHALTTSDPKQELLIILTNASGVFYAKYDSFVIGREDEGYTINQLGTMSGQLQDALRYHLHQKFSTYDNDNSQKRNCADHHGGGWWYKDCYQCNLNASPQSKYGATWLVSGNYPKLQGTQMMIRPCQQYRAGEQLLQD